MTIWIKNNTNSDKTWIGQLVSIGSYYQIQPQEIIPWSNDSELLTDVALGNAIVAKDDSGNADITDINLAINHLKSLLTDVKIIEEEVSTGGHYQTKGFRMNIDSSDETKILNFSFPIDIGLLSASWVGRLGFDGDWIEIMSAPATVIGFITSDTTINDTVITVDQTTIDNIKIGYYLDLTDGTNSDDCGRVLSIDKVNSTITIENPLSNSYLVSSPTFCLMTIKFTPQLYLDDSGVLSVGESKIGASFVPAGTIIRVVYHNDNATTKSFNFLIEYLY